MSPECVRLRSVACEGLSWMNVNAATGGTRRRKREERIVKVRARRVRMGRVRLERVGEFLARNGLRGGVSARDEGNMSFVWGDSKEVSENRKIFFKRVGVDAGRSVVMVVEHGNRVVEVGEKQVGVGVENNQGVQADGLVTKKRGVALGLLTADCYPVIMVSRESGVLGLVHAGWQSADAGVIREAVERLARLGADSPTLEVWLGPGIGKKSYIVDEPRQEGRPEWKDFIERAGDGYRVDLLGFVKQQLLVAGVVSENIYQSAVDTVVSDDFFSHRRETRSGRKEGRTLTVVGIRRL